MRVVAGVVTHCDHQLRIQQCPEHSPYMQAARAVAEAKVRYAEHFLAAKVRGKGQVTDGQAHQEAISATKSELDVLQARLELERSNL